MLFLIPDELASDGIDLQTGVACLDCARTVVISLCRRFDALRRLGQGRTQAVPRSATQPMRQTGSLCSSAHADLD
jgi:hypothetical protein